jgi:hypothetical protein
MTRAFTTIAALAGLALAAPATAQQQQQQDYWQAGQQAQQDQQWQAQQQRDQQWQQDRLRARQHRPQQPAAQDAQTPFDFDWLYIETPTGPDVMISDEALWQMHRGMTITGEVIGTRDIEIRGETHKLVRVRTDQGTTATIDLGTGDLPFQVREGQRFSATGDLGRIQNTPVLMADRVQYQQRSYQIGHRAHVDGQRIIPRQEQVREMRQPMQQQELMRLHGRQVELRGQVLSTSTATVEGRQHTLARVRTDRGNVLSVDLGTGELDFELRQGMTIQATGPLGQHQNQPTVFARTVRAQDETFILDQPRRPRPGEQPRLMGQPPRPQDRMTPPGQQRQQDRVQPPGLQRQQERFQQDTDRPEQLTVQGTLLDARLVNLQGEADRHVLAKVQTQEYGTMIIDLGPHQQVRQQLSQKQVRLRSGQDLTLSGVPGRINDRPVLMAQRLETADTAVELPKARKDKAKAREHKDRN